MGSQATEAYEVSDEDDDTPYGRLSVNPHGMNVDTKGVEGLLFKSIDELQSVEARENTLYTNIKMPTVSVETNIQEMAREGLKLDMFRGETLEKMT
mmetsp:Transcript_24806/g.33203  ORF Transcript_24806/g.33203 Transcript_24806/m.33203 type:complete len:96 (+) Transcript_24806:1694-1981(+)